MTRKPISSLSLILIRQNINSILSSFIGKKIMFWQKLNRKKFRRPLSCSRMHNQPLRIIKSTYSLTLRLYKSSKPTLCHLIKSFLSLNTPLSITVPHWQNSSKSPSKSKKTGPSKSKKSSKPITKKSKQNYKLKCKKWKSNWEKSPINAKLPNKTLPISWKNIKKDLKTFLTVWPTLKITTLLTSELSRQIFKIKSRKKIRKLKKPWKISKSLITKSSLLDKEISTLRKRWKFWKKICIKISKTSTAVSEIKAARLESKKVL